MINFDRGNNRFNYRIVGVVINGDKVLVHKAETDNFWTFPGGRAEFGETAEETIKREIKEELGLDIKVSRLLWFVENFFNYQEKNYHEIALYFLIEFPPSNNYLFEKEDFLGLEKDTKLIFKWVKKDRETLSNLPLFPIFLQRNIETLPSVIEHIIEDDRV